MSTPHLAPIVVARLKALVGHLRDREDDIRRALQRLFTGF